MRSLQSLFRCLLAIGALTTSAAYAGTAFQSSDLARAVYQEPQEDLRVKVMGGAVVIQRSFVDGGWHPNLTWKKLEFTFDNLDGSVQTIDRNGIKYERTGSNVYNARADFRSYFRSTPTGFRWADRQGNSIDYDVQGYLTSYSDRNDIKVSFSYETVGTTKRVTGISDHFGTQVLTFEYTGSQLTAIRDTTNRRVQYRYNSNGNLSEVIDVLGNSWTYGYTGSTLVSHTDPEGRTLTRQFTTNGFSGGFTYADGTKTEYTFDYDSSKRQHYVREKTGTGKITESWIDEEGDVIRKDLNGRTISTLVKDTAAHTRTETDARGLKTIREYDQWLNVTKIVYPDGATVSTTYDPVFSNVTQKIDERSVITKYEYDAKGNLTRITEALGRTEQRVTEYTYDQYGNRLTQKRLGDAFTQEATATFEYDTSGNPTALIDAEGFRTEWSSFDAAGNARTKRDARQKLWTRTYDAKGTLTSESDPLNHGKRIEYDKAGLRKKTIDAVNNETTHAYDTRGNLVSVTDPYGGVIRYEYNGDNQQTKQTDQEGKSQATEYDVDGRLLKRIDGNGNVIQYVYGDPTSGLDNLLVKTLYPTYSQEYKYDNRDRVIEVIDILDANTRFSSKTVYDPIGNRTATTDKENKTTTFAYDALGRLTGTTDPASGLTQYAYDCRDNLIALTDPKNQTHRFEYDRRNLKTREIRPLGQAIAYIYTATGQLDSMIDAKGQVKRHVYDDAGRRTGENHFTTASAGTPVKAITYTYNNRAGLTGYNDGTTQGATSYDVRQLRKAGEIVNYGSFSLSYSVDYYANGLKKSFTGPDGVTVNYTYDTNNQLSAVQLPIGNITVNTYQWYWPIQTTLPGGTTRTQAYDPLMRLTAINVKDPAQNPVLNYQYSYDKADNITQKATEHGNYSYAYDNLYRLTAATNPSPLISETYTYDPIGNRITDSQTPGNWQYDADNQLTQAGTNISFTYDANGNTTTKTEGTNVTNYIWDTFDRLIEVRDGSNNLIASYAYDPFARRLWKEVNTTRTYFFYADEGLIAEANNSGAVTNLYGNRPKSAWGTDPVYLKQGNSYYFFQNDHLGTSKKLLAQTGTVVWSVKAQAFGQTIVDPSSTITNNLRFPGQYFDSETGMHYNWNRYYDAKTGRYITKDPIGLRGGINFYTYANQNPNRNVDARGLSALFSNSECGPEGGWTYPGDFYFWNFNSACRNHDRCYDICRVNKLDCDVQFYWDMHHECERLLLEPHLYLACLDAATAYFGAVVLFGGDAFDAAQRKSCKCN
jgi:RHS repeat-associated protein